MIQKLLLFLVILISGCGFHLRGQNLLPPQLHCIKIDSIMPYGDFESTLRRSLVQLGVDVTRTGSAPVTLRIISTALYNDVPTIGGSNQARVYVFYYKVHFEVFSDQGVIIPPQCVTSSETLIVNAGKALESTNQLEVLKLEMQKEAAHMIINMLHARPFEMITKCSPQRQW